MDDDALQVKARCPGCGTSGLAMRTVRHDVPYFGESVQTLVLCPGCGYRHVDFLVVEQEDPARWTLEVQGPDDLAIRVVRSSTCTIRIPEVGLVAEPAARTEAFVSNVEGLLRRMRDAFEWAGSVAEADHDLARAREGKRDLDDALAGERELTIVLEDPRGNSLIGSDRAEREVLTEEEAEELEMGMVVLDREDLVEAAEGDGSDGDPATGS